MDWQRLIVIAAVIAIAVVVARLVDRRLARKPLDPAMVTRYRVLRRTVSTGIVAVGVLSALLLIPSIRAVAGGILASSAVLGLVIGLAAQRTLSNFVAGILIAFTQPLRIGDVVEVDGQEGTVEEIDLTYTFIRQPDGTRFVIPNEKLASDTIRNATIRSPEKVAEITLQVPLTNDLEAVVASLQRDVESYHGADVFVSALNGNATVTVRVPTSEAESEQLERELRLRAHTRLRAEGIFQQ
jgi:small conductance mechanosensitive channel